MLFYDFKIWDDIISRVLSKKRQYFLWKEFKTYEKMILLIMFFVIEFYFTIASYQFFKK